MRMRTTPTPVCFDPRLRRAIDRHVVADSRDRRRWSARQRLARAPAAASAPHRAERLRPAGPRGRIRAFHPPTWRTGTRVGRGSDPATRQRRSFHRPPEPRPMRGHRWGVVGTIDPSCDPTPCPSPPVHPPAAFAQAAGKGKSRALCAARGRTARRARGPTTPGRDRPRPGQRRARGDAPAGRGEAEPGGGVRRVLEANGEHPAARGVAEWLAGEPVERPGSKKPRSRSARRRWRRDLARPGSRA